MDNKFFSIDDILVLADKVSQAGLGSIELELDGCRLKIEGKKTKQQVIAASAPQLTMAAPVSSEIPNTAEENNSEIVTNHEDSGTAVKSPIVGTFYASPAPDKEPFVFVGKHVKKGDVLFIIESMKLMNEVLSEQDGIVKKIIANDGQAVEFGEPIMIIE